MTAAHPIISITGSSGAGTTSVKRIFELIFRREKVAAAFIEGDAFHRFNRADMKARIADEEAKGNPNFSHFNAEANELDKRDVNWLVPHQANIRIIDAMGRKLGLAPDRVVKTVDRHANTSAASVPLALAEAVCDGRIRRGDLVLLEAIGGGLTWGAALVRF